MITAAAAQRMEEAVNKLEQMDHKRPRVVPQSYDFVGELANVRALLRMDQPAEALERLERAMDRHCSAWRASIGKTQWERAGR